MATALGHAEKSSFLAPTHYDDDARSVHSDQNSEDEDESTFRHDHTSFELAEYDRAMLLEEEERERLLTKSTSAGALRSIFSGGHDNSSNVRLGKSEQGKQRRRNRKVRKRRKKRSTDEEGELMFEMDEGGRINDKSSESSRSSIEIEKSILKTKSRRVKLLHFTIIPSALAAFFFVLILGAYRMSRSSFSSDAISILSNGTSYFESTTILISLDGFRADFLDRDLTPNLNDFISKGVSPKYMLPSFPSVTFPNHYTLVTGLYPESHGVVGNTFWDPKLNEEFFYTDPARSMHSKWWDEGEPLWVTAERSGIKSAIHMWPGSEAHIQQLEPTFLDKYNGTEILSRKVDRILELLDLPSQDDPDVSPITTQRPRMILAYVPNIDADGHEYGPNSTEIRTTISNVDNMLRDLLTGLEDRNLTNVVNVVVVSDHGMATTSTDRLIQLDNLIDLDLVEHVDGWPLYGLRPKNPLDLRGLYDRLSVESARNSNFEVYLRDENMPERYHFSNNDRIAPLWIVPKTGWAVVHKEEFDVDRAKENGEIYHPRGLHGYDHEHPLMRAIFIARGPAFPHTPNSRLDVFQNIEVYNIICDSLGIEPNSNNGTLRLPLRPVGLHSDRYTKTDEPPADLPPDPQLTPSSIAPTSTGSSIGVDEPDLLPVRPVINDGVESATEPEAQEKPTTKFWAAFIAKIKAAKAWIKDFISKSKTGSA